MDLVIPESVKHATPIVTCTVEGILDQEDLRQILVDGLSTAAGEAIPSLTVVPDDPSDLKKIREKHHAIARSIAGGMTQRLTAMLAGMTEQYIGVLLKSPAIIELVEMYRIQQGAGHQLITEKLKTVGLKALEGLEAKIDAGEANTQELIGAAKLGMDRSGHGPQSSHHHVNEEHKIDHAEIAKLNLEARRRSSEYIVPISEVRAVLAPPPIAESESDEEPA